MGRPALRLANRPMAGFSPDGYPWPEDHVVHFGGVNAAPFQRGLDDGGSELGGRHIAQRAAEISDRGADRRNNGYSSHNDTPCPPDADAQCNCKIVPVSYSLPVTV